MSAFGGTIKIGNKEYAVRGRTYKKISEQDNWWKSQCFCPIKELRILLSKNEHLKNHEFAADWLKATKRVMFSEKELISRILSSASAKRFDIWQACREDGLTLECLDAFLDELDNESLHDFLDDADKKMALANGVGELEYLEHCFSKTIPAPSISSPIEAMIAQACVRNKNRILLTEIMDSTPEAVRTLFEDPEIMGINHASEEGLSSGDTVAKKRLDSICDNAARNLIEGKRIDSWRSPEDQKKENKPKRNRKIPSAKDRNLKKKNP